MATAETKRIEGRYVVIPLVVLTAVVASVFLTIQLSGRGAKETNYLLLSYTAGLRDVEEGYYTDAVKNLTPVIKSGTRPEAFGWRGEAFLRMKKYAEAEADFREAIRREPNTPANHAGLGAALVGRNRRAEAIDEFDKAMELLERPDAPQPGTVRRTGDELAEVKKLREAASSS
ncbi:MAG: tetratricopeptide repeat protein [Planctomycetota bacterium]|nr:tetratricopeptide repeat protein [Planctomycetaceae bacterium]MDQ3330124.1 tetratricopeptide repeat protein [Planctomycetota bacterium]